MSPVDLDAMALVLERLFTGATSDRERLSRLCMALQVASNDLAFGEDERSMLASVAAATLTMPQVHGRLQ